MESFRILWNYFGIHGILAILDFTEVWLMNFSLLEYFHSKWQDILVIGKTTERNGIKYHIVGMTLSDEAKLYIIEPYMEPERHP